MSYLLKTNTNLINLNVNQLYISDYTKYDELTSYPNNPENGMIIYYIDGSGNKSLQLYNGTGWETIANTSNNTFNNLTVNNLSVTNVNNLPFLKTASITYKVEYYLGNYLLTAFSSTNYNNIALDASNNVNDFKKGIIYIDLSGCGINNIKYINCSMTYCDDPNTCLLVRPYNLIYMVPPPNQLVLYTYVYDQFRIITDFKTESAGNEWIFNLLINYL